MGKTLKINKKNSTIKTRPINKPCIKTKECFVNVIRLSKRELDMYAKSEVIVANFDLKISSKFLQIGDNRKYSDSQTYNLTLKKQLSGLVLEHCEEIARPNATTKLKVPLVAAPKQLSPNKLDIPARSSAMPLSSVTTSKILEKI